MTAPLVTRNQLGKRLNLPHEQVDLVLKNAGVQPVHQYNAGSGQVYLFDEAAAVPALEEFIRVSAVPPEAPPSIGTQILQAIQQVTEQQQDLANRLGFTLQAEGKDLEEWRTATTTAVSKLHDQNVLLLRAINDLKIDVGNRIDALLGSIDRLAHPADPAEASPTPPLSNVVALAPAKPEPKKLRVAVVGIMSNQRAFLEQEFKDAFALRITTTDALSSSGKLEQAIAGNDVAIVMSNFVHHGADAARKAGVPLIKVSGGGLTALREKLTELFCNADEYRRAG